MNLVKKIWLYGLLIKLVISAWIPLSADEAYYWVWSKNLQLSFLDHPPFVAWLFRLGHTLEPFMNAVRWPAVLLGHLTLYVWFQILKNYFDEDKILTWLLVMYLSPMTGLGSLVVTPDLPLLFFWSCSLFCFIKILRSPNIINYILLGASLGLGFCSKYHIVLFVLFAIPYLIFEKKYKNISWKYVPYTILSGLVFSAPVLIWNFQNDFASFKYQMSHGFHEDNWRWQWPINYILGETLLIFPPLLYYAIKSWPQKQFRIFHYFSWSAFIFFFVSSLHGDVELNWPLVAFPAVFVLAVSSGITKTSLRTTYAFWICVYLIISLNTFFHLFKMPNDKIAESNFFKNNIELVDKYRPLLTSDYQMASIFWYLTKQPVYKLYQSCRSDFFDTFSSAKPNTDKFYLIKEAHHELPEWLNTQDWHFKEIQKFENNILILEISK